MTAPVPSNGRRRVLVAVECPPLVADALRRHPDCRVVWAAWSGMERPAGDATPPAHDDGEVLLLTSAQVAHRLGLSDRTARALMASGALPSLTIGRARRVRATDLNDYVQRLGQGPA